MANKNDNRFRIDCTDAGDPFTLEEVSTGFSDLRQFSESSGRIIPPKEWFESPDRLRQELRDLEAEHCTEANEAVNQFFMDNNEPPSSLPIRILLVARGLYLKDTIQAIYPVQTFGNVWFVHHADSLTDFCVWAGTDLWELLSSAGLDYLADDLWDDLARFPPREDWSIQPWFPQPA